MNRLIEFFRYHAVELCTVGAIILVLLFSAASYAQPAYTPSDMAIKLEASTALLSTGRGHCTATKIGSRMWLTAGHCADTGLRLETESGYLYPRSITIAAQEKQEGNRDEDWAIINTADEDRDIPPLSLGCNDAVYPGLPVRLCQPPGRR